MLSRPGCSFSDSSGQELVPLRSCGRGGRWVSTAPLGRGESFYGTDKESQGLGHLPPPPLPGLGQHFCGALLRKQCLRNSYAWPLASPVSGRGGMADREIKVKTLACLLVSPDRDSSPRHICMLVSQAAGCDVHLCLCALCGTLRCVHVGPLHP